MRVLLNSPAHSRQLVDAFVMAVNVAELQLSWKVMVLVLPSDTNEGEGKYGAVAYLGKGTSKDTFNRASPRIILVPMVRVSKIYMREALIVFGAGGKGVANPLWNTEDYPNDNPLYWKHRGDFGSLVMEFKRMVSVVTKE